MPTGLYGSPQLGPFREIRDRRSRAQRLAAFLTLDPLWRRVVPARAPRLILRGSTVLAWIAFGLLAEPAAIGWYSSSDLPVRVRSVLSRTEDLVTHSAADVQATDVANAPQQALLSSATTQEAPVASPEVADPAKASAPDRTYSQSGRTGTVLASQIQYTTTVDVNTAEAEGLFKGEVRGGGLVPLDERKHGEVAEAGSFADGNAGQRRLDRGQQFASMGVTSWWH